MGVLKTAKTDRSEVDLISANEAYGFPRPYVRLRIPRKYGSLAARFSLCDGVLFRETSSGSVRPTAEELCLIYKLLLEHERETHT